MKKHLPRIVSIVLTGIVCSASYSQSKDTLEMDMNEQKILRYARFKPGHKDRKMSAAIPFLQKALNAKNGETFVLLSSKRDELGITHNKYQQVYKGIPLEGVLYIVHGKGDDIEAINGQFVPVALASVIPQLNPEKALKKALGYVNAKKYAWEDAEMELWKKQNPVNGRSTYKPEAALVIAEDLHSGSKQWKLAYKFRIFSLEPFNDQIVYIDANNGGLFGMISAICNSNSPSTGQTYYSGTRNMITDSYSGQYRLRENRNGVDIFTLNANRTGTYISATDFYDNDNNWTAAEHNNSMVDQAALDAHWGAEMTLDYFRNVHSRNSLDGLGKAIRGFVHYGNFDNAGWVNNDEVIIYGDGGVGGKPLTSLDVVAHELGHGINKFEANLTYSGESGALNEGFSDIWAALVENYAAPEKDHWTIGEELILSDPFNRSMRKPNASVGTPQPNTYGGTYWHDPNNCNLDQCGVHTNSGVLNFCFYLMSEGGSGQNDHQWNYSVTGMGMAKAARIAYRALTYHLTPNSKFADARNAFIASAKFIFGDCSAEAIATTNAWHAVGVGAAYVPPPPFTIVQEYRVEDCNTFTARAQNLNFGMTWHTTYAHGQLHL